jgi:hypothetical protein
MPPIAFNAKGSTDLLGASRAEPEAPPSSSA